METPMNQARGRWVTAAEAVQAVRSGDTIMVANACGEPRTVMEALADRAGELRGVRTAAILILGRPSYLRREIADSIRHISLFCSTGTRVAVNEGWADFMPCFFNQVPSMIGTHIPADVAMISVSPPDEDGYCSLGVSVDYSLRAAQVCRTVIAEVNPTMPRLYGDCMVHVSDVDYLVHVDRAIPEVPPSAPDEAERKTGENAAALIDDGATLQIGIGAMPEVVCSRLRDRKDLGVHSEMISDAVMDLVCEGAITNARKTLHPGKIVATFIMGSRRLYDWLDRNPLVEMHPVSYTNDPAVICRNRKMVAVNAALEVDLLGQVCSDTLGQDQYSGVGGQVDFVRGARLSEGGKAIIVLTSTARNGTVSRIVPALKHGAVVTTSRNDVDYVVTEYGAAQLHGKTVAGRMRALIDIAHPDFREELELKAYALRRAL
jgi:4-hydroxybutyrate CoA-transferase